MIKNSTLLLFLSVCWSWTFGQTQTGIIKNPEYTVMAGYDSKYGSSVVLPDNSMAMIVSVPKADFAIVNLDSKLTQKWLSPLTGFPLAVGKFKNNILIVAATDRSWFKSFSGSYKAILLDETSGKMLSEKIIYEGSQTFLEDPDFYFAKDGSYFKMTARLTGMKRKTNFFGVNRSDKDYRATQDFNIIEFDDNLSQRNKISPNMPPGESWNVSCSADGSFLITTMDKAAGKINVATYISSSADPIKTVSIPVTMRKSSDISGIYSTASTQPFISYAAFTYLNTDKEISLFVARIDFKNSTYKVTNEVFDNRHVKDLRNTFTPVNKKYDNLEFSQIDFLGVKHIAEYGDKLLVSVAPAFIQTSGRGSVAFEGSVLMNVYDQDLKQAFHQFIPRVYMSLSGEGSKIAYSLKNNIFRLIANVKAGSLSSTSSLYAEMDFTNGKMLKMNKVPDDDIGSGHYVNPESVSWLDGSCIVPYLDRQRVLSTKLHTQIQLLSY